MLDVEMEFEELMVAIEGDADAPVGTTQPMPSAPLQDLCDLAADTGARANERAGVAAQIKLEGFDQLSATHNVTSDDDNDPMWEPKARKRGLHRPRATIIAPHTIDSTQPASKVDTLIEKAAKLLWMAQDTAATKNKRAVAERAAAAVAKQLNCPVEDLTALLDRKKGTPAEVCSEVMARMP